MSDEFDPLTLHLRGETSCQTQIWIEIFWTQLFPNFPELTRSEIACEIGTCNSRRQTISRGQTISRRQTTSRRRTILRSQAISRQ